MDATKNGLEPLRLVEWGADALYGVTRHPLSEPCLQR